MLRWGQRAPTKASDDYFNITALLFEIAIGKVPGDVKTACEQVLDSMKERGYNSDKLRQYRQFMTRTKLFRLHDLARRLATFRRKIGWRWLLDRIDWFAENCKIGRIWVDVGRDH